MKSRKFSEGMLNDDLILQSLCLKPGQTVLDAGCGNGYMAKKISNLVGKTGTVFAIDPEKESIRVLKKQVRETNIEALIGDITQTTEVRGCSIDLVYLALVFHIFSDDQVLRFEEEVRRVLKSDGKLAIVNIDKTDTPFGPPLEKRSSPEELIRKLSLTPFDCIKVGDHFYMQMFTKQ